MPDIATQLRDYYDDLVRPTDPADIVADRVITDSVAFEVTLSPRVRAWWRRPSLSLVGSLVVTLLLLGSGALLLLPGDAADETVAVAPVPVTSQDPPAIAATPTTFLPGIADPSSIGMKWQRIPDAPVFANGWITAVATTGSNLVAVGYRLEQALPADWHSNAAIWVSSDGTEWERTNDPAAFSAVEEPSGNDEYLIDVYTTPRGIFAVGFDGSSLATWVSDDGRTWSRSPSTPPGRVIEFDGGFAMAAADSMWFSADGSEWTRITDAAFSNAEVYEAVAAGPGLVAVGRTNPSDPSGAIWVSANGLAWERVAENQAATVRQFESVITDPLGTRIIAFGWGATFVSDDGHTWRQADTPLGEPPPSSNGVWDGDRLVIVGRVWSDSPGVWVSDDQGATIHRLNLDAASRSLTPDLTDVVSFGSQFVAVGGDRGAPQQGQILGGSPMIGKDGRGAVWIGTWNSD